MYSVTEIHGQAGNNAYVFNRVHLIVQLWNTRIKLGITDSSIPLVTACMANPFWEPKEIRPIKRIVLSKRGWGTQTIMGIIH